MSTIVTQVTRHVTPDYRMFGFGDEGGLRPDSVPGSKWCLWSPTFVFVGTAQDVVSIEVVFELWDGPPDMTAEAAEVETTGVFHAPTGNIALDQITAGMVLGVITIPAGSYDVRLSGRNRDRTNREIEQCFDDPEGADFDHLHGQERYTVQFWPRT